MGRRRRQAQHAQGCCLTRLLAGTLLLGVVLPFKLIFWWPLKVVFLALTLPLVLLDRLLEARRAHQRQRSDHIQLAYQPTEHPAKPVPRYWPLLALQDPALEQLKRLDPLDFEQEIAAAFARLGWQVTTTPRSGDEGVDLLLHNAGTVAVVQCKRYDGSVGASVVRDLYGAMMHCNAGQAYLVTTGNITTPARGWCRGKPIELIDATNLSDWLRTTVRHGGALQGANISLHSARFQDLLERFYRLGTQERMIILIILVSIVFSACQCLVLASGTP